MTIATGLVYFAIVWTVVFFILNPLWQVSQSESGAVEPGTPESAPVDAMVLKKAAITTVVAVVLVAASYVVLDRGLLTLEDVGWATPPSLR